MAFAQPEAFATAALGNTHILVKDFGFPILDAPTVTPQTTSATTTKSAYSIKGTAYSSLGIARVEVAKNSPNAVYSGANGRASWFYNANPLQVGLNIFYVRSLDSTGQKSTPVRVVVRRSNAPTPTPTPSSTP